MENLIKQIEAMKYDNAFKPYDKDAAFNFNHGIDIAISILRKQPVIKAKALRKKGTDEWYWEGIKPNWDLLTIPNCIQDDCTMNEVENYYEYVPIDAELIDIEITYRGKEESEG